MKTLNTKLITQGIFAFAVVAVVGTTTAVYAVTNATENNTSGYGTGAENAVSASQQFDASFVTLSSEFDTDIAGIVSSARTQLTPTGAAALDEFNASFNAESAQLDSNVAAASEAFRMKVVTAMGTGESKDKFIDTFNNAKAEYFNSLDAAKNKFASVVSNLGHQSNVTKDQFMNGFNSTRDAYGNDLEGIKNQFADRVSINR